MIVSVCGYGSTGSSAVSDYLTECENTQVLDRLEFTIAQSVDGLCDLAYHLLQINARQANSIVAIQRFQSYVARCAKGWHKKTGISVKDIERLTEEFIDSITQVKYIGFSPSFYKLGNRKIEHYLGTALILNRIVRPLEKLGVIKRNFNFYPLTEVRFSSHPENFYPAAKRYVHDLLQGMGVDFSKIVVLDQAFSGCDPERGFEFYDDPYSIVVDRDPRDVYIFAKTVLLSQGRFMPTANVGDFITYYRGIRQNKHKVEKSSRCLFVQFEDMVYNYEQAVEKIDRFFDVRNYKRNTIFVPEMSRANTNLVNRFPEFAEDVKVIEKKLEEFLFDFSQYPVTNGQGKMFYGKSLLNRNR